MKQLYIIYEYDEEDNENYLYIEELDNKLYGDTKCINSKEYYAINNKKQFKRFIDMCDSYGVDYSFDRLQKMPLKNFKENLLWLIHNEDIKNKVCYNEDYRGTNDLKTQSCEELPLEKELKDFQQYIFEYCDKHKLKVDLKAFDLLDIKEIKQKRKNELIEKYEKEIKSLQSRIEKIKNE